MKKEEFSVKVLAEVAIFAALAFGLDFFQGAIWKGVFPNGGSIGLAMVPILIICYRRGFLAGFLCGLILSLVQMLGGVYVIQGSGLENEFLKVAGPFIQVMLDYVLAYTVVGFTGLFRNSFVKSNHKYLNLSIGVTVGGLLKYACHVVAGLLFWPGEIFGISGSAYSFIYNGLYCIPNIVISVIIIILLYKFYTRFFNEKGEE